MLVNTSILILALASLMPQVTPNERLVGRWKAVEDTNGFYITLESLANGSYSETVSMEGGGTYKVRRNRVHFSGGRMDPEVSEYRIEGNTLLLQTPKGVDRFVRERGGEPNAAPIVGRWKREVAREGGPGI